MIGLAVLGMGGQAAAQTPDESGRPGMVEVAVEVELTCPSCAQGLERRLSRLDHVARVEIQDEDGLVVLGFDPGSSVALEAVRDVIRNAGFTPAGFSLTAVGRVTEVNGTTALALSDDIVVVLAGDRVGALAKAAGGAVARVRGDVSLATDGGAPVLTVGDFDLP